MGRRMEWVTDMGSTLVLARTWGDTVALWCDGCGQALEPSPYWSMSKVQGLHERGEGHKVRRLAYA